MLIAPTMVHSAEDRGAIAVAFCTLRSSVALGSEGRVIVVDPPHPDFRYVAQLRRPVRSYLITFDDGTQATIKAFGSGPARITAQRTNARPVVKIELAP